MNQKITTISFESAITANNFRYQGKITNWSMEKESVTLENRSHLLIKSQERMTYLKFLKPYYFRIQSLFLFFNFLCLSSCCSNTLSASLLTIPREDITARRWLSHLHAQLHPTSKLSLPASVHGTYFWNFVQQCCIEWI